uniref:Uncharacterized protein n=1 Tax=Romanomermis culicivorax TaxID=13658 RepID=A0A915L3U4_ROMCU
MSSDWNSNKITRRICALSPVHTSARCSVSMLGDARRANICPASRISSTKNCSPSMLGQVKGKFSKFSAFLEIPPRILREMGTTPHKFRVYPSLNRPKVLQPEASKD